MGRGGPGDPVPGNLRNLNMISVTAAPHSCHIHWVDWLKLSISLLFGAQWRQNLAMVVGAASWSSARWQTDSHVSSVNILWLMVVVVSPVEEDPVAADCWLLSVWLWYRPCRRDAWPEQTGYSTASSPSWDWEISCWGLPGVPVLAQPGNIINTNYLLLPLTAPDCHWHQRTEPRTFITLY